MQSNRTKALFKHTTRVLGSLLVLLSGWVVASKLYANWSKISSLESCVPIALLVAFGAVAYCIVSFLLPSAWIILIRNLGAENSSSAWYSIYARSQIGKYLPGNVFHFAGRHLMGRELGVSHSTLAGATVFEAAGLIGGACTVSIIGGLVGGGGASSAFRAGYFLILAGALTLPFTMNWMLRRSSLRHSLQLPAGSSIDLLRAMAPSFLRYMLFFFMSGVVLLMPLTCLSGWKGLEVAGITICTYAASWVAGYIIPGAPAGVGIRESILVLSLTSLIGEPQSLAVALIFRFITVTGDVLFFLSSFRTTATNFTSGE